MTISVAELKTYEDHDLIALIQQDNRSAFDQIYTRYWQKLYNAGYKRLKDSEQAEEIVQDVFIDLWLKRHTHQIQKLSNYLHSCIKYQVYALYRKAESHPFFEIPVDFIAADSLEADSMFNAKELNECILAWLKLQPEKRSEIFRLKYSEGLTSTEIALKLNLSRKTVQNQILTTTNNLREYISKLMILMLMI